MVRVPEDELNVICETNTLIDTQPNRDSSAGIVGSGIIRVFLQNGATVIAPVRSEEGKSSLLKEIIDVQIDGAIDIPIIGYGNEDSITLLPEYINKHYPNGLDIVVSNFGGSFKLGAVSSLTSDDLISAFARATPHLLLSKSMFSLIKPQKSSSYMFIDGMLGERCSMPNCAALGIVNAAIYGIIRSLEAEHVESPVRINELRIGALIRRDSQSKHPFIDGHAYPSSLIGEEALAVAVDETRRCEIVRVFSEYLKDKEEGKVVNG